MHPPLRPSPDFLPIDNLIKKRKETEIMLWLDVALCYMRGDKEAKRNRDMIISRDRETDYTNSDVRMLWQFVCKI